MPQDALEVHVLMLGIYEFIPLKVGDLQLLTGVRLVSPSDGLVADALVCRLGQA